MKTSHEQRAARPWDDSYREAEPAPWDIGWPQPAISGLASGEKLAGSVLDAGCGTGENALYIAGLGHSVLGIDASPTAVEIARRKARERGITAEFAIADALHLVGMNRTFQTVIDCGLFHTFDADERRQYLASLATVTEPGGILFILCFSDGTPQTGPHPVSESELRGTFAMESDWRLDAVQPAQIETRLAGRDLPAWLATASRV